LLIARSARNAHRDHHKQLNLAQIVPRHRVVEVTERVDRTGTGVVRSPRPRPRAIGELVERGVEALAISLLWEAS